MSYKPQIYADLIWSELNTKEAESKTKEEQKAIIEEILSNIISEEQMITKNKVMNHLIKEMNNLNIKSSDT